MKLRTELPISAQAPVINHKSPLLLVGSCFSENIGSKLEKYKFNSTVNPLGIAYNPLSIHNLIGMDQNELYSSLRNSEFKNGLYFNFHLHSVFNHPKKNAFYDKIHESYAIQENRLNELCTIFISYGTAWVYELKTNGEVVNNCHKLPSNNFDKRILEPQEIIDSWEKLNKKLSSLYNTSFNFVFTISPVRHLKDGFHENQLSKSVLHLAIEKIRLKNENCFYFPSYEVMMDDLRDYRFYAEDLIHPNQTAIDYIWTKFSDAFFDSNTQALNHNIEKVVSAVSHRPFHPKSKQHQDFLRKLHSNIEKLTKNHNLDFQRELNEIKSQLLS